MPPPLVYTPQEEPMHHPDFYELQSSDVVEQTDTERNTVSAVIKLSILAINYHEHCVIILFFLII